MKHGTSPITSGSLNAVSMLSDTDGWAVGEKAPGYPLVLRWNGNIWTEVPVPSIPMARLHSVSLISPTLGWAVGSKFIFPWDGYDPLILYWDGTQWERVSAPVAGVVLESVEMVSAKEAWAVGYRGIYSDAVILHWACNNWTVVPSPTDHRLTSIAMNSPTDGWAVGVTGTILRYVGTETNNCLLLPLIAK